MKKNLHSFSANYQSIFIFCFALLLNVGVINSQTEIAINGGFETGDFTGWTQFANGTQTIITTNPSEGTYCAELNNTVAQSASLIKNANIGIGTVTASEEVTIKFDARGTLADGGVAFAEFFSELTGGGVSSSVILGGGPLALNADPNVWTSFSFTTTTGPDVSGGVTLQLTATTGGAPSSIAQMFYDKVSVITTTLGINDFETTDFSVYPNPSNDAWNVKTSNTIMNSIQVFDVLGKQVLSLEPRSNNVSIDASELTKGLYFAKIESDTGTSNIKLIKN